MSWSAWNANGNGNTAQQTMGRQSAKGAVSRARGKFQGGSKPQPSQHGWAKPQPTMHTTPKPSPAKNTNKHHFKGLAPGAWGKKGSHWTLARPQAASAPVKGDTGAPTPSPFEAAPPARSVYSSATMESDGPAPMPMSMAAPKRSSLRQSLGRTMQSVRSSLSRKSQDVTETKSSFSEEEEEESQYEESAGFAGQDTMVRGGDDEDNASERSFDAPADEGGFDEGEDSWSDDDDEDEEW